MAKKSKSLDYAKIQSDILKMLINKPTEKSKYSFGSVFLSDGRFCRMVVLDGHVVYIIPNNYWYLNIPEEYYDIEKSNLITDLYQHTIADCVPAVKVGLREMNDGSIAEKYVSESDIVDEFAYFKSKLLKPFGDCSVWITNQNGAALITKKQNRTFPLGLVMPVTFTSRKDETNE